MEPLVLAPLNSLESNLNSLITSLTQTNTFTNAPQIAKDLLTSDDNLTSSLRLLQRHQQNYARILNLRAEVADLQEQLKETIRRCVALRQELGQIHPSILDTSDSDEDNDRNTKVAEVDYHTLLAFAARIGKHNADAAREAEAESVRRRIEASQAKNNASTTANRVPGSTGQGAEAQDNATAETEAELDRINSTIALNRAQMGMAFPEANMLRVGQLGQLQLFRERQVQSGGGDEIVQAAVEREVERMVRETEDIADAKMEEIEEAGSSSGSGSGGARLSPEATRWSTAGTTGAKQPSSGGRLSQKRPSASTEQKPKKKVDLDLPSSDDEDED
ncbi:uncharacterized protein Z518_06975 [Rhinocladiella mackenziei CBS 650.93]|uniref:Mediator of RNA polymerase II transcription subunit 4 n=1 Tax=Rhinocladiella mackenziei CBS 650.93 TaxID=1442369 RepID=A0A0D2GZ33_9EURO|nr:uncharacterized protein Z518_06975 [Rhinocladiella mackenziei CBS 650.93]KIX03423.1 hypothetical protein Z518_06975 [Rhinocladiella mackenziei CBS 650.93]